MTDQLYDCIVIGAGPAGLSASLFLARYRRRVLTFHHNSPRNIYSHGVHGFLGYDGIPPTKLLTRGREEVESYGGFVEEGCVTHVERIGDERFRVTAGELGGEQGGEAGRDSVQSFDARRLVLATGLRDLTPDCPGFREFYGLSVHHCPDCDGFEATGKRLVVLGNGKKTVSFALGLLTWTDKLTLVTGGDPDDMTAEHRARLESLGIPVLDRAIVALEGDTKAGLLERARLDDGGALECDALFFNLGTVPASNLHETLGCRLDPECGLVWVDEDQQTSVPGVYAAGDLTPRSQLAVVAAAEGAMAAIHVHKSLIPESQRV